MRKFFSRFKAIFFITGLTAIGIVGIILLFNKSNQDNINFIARYTIHKAEEKFKEVQKNKIDTLAALLPTLMEIEDIKKNFQNSDRKALLQSALPLYEKFKNNYCITHWYFSYPEPDSRCFLRIHSPEKHGDLITRDTFKQSVQTKKLAVGIELGKTAFAIRAVQPYYDYGNGKNLLGYMELGIDMVDFLGCLKQRTALEFGLLIKKKYLDREKWGSVVTKKNIRNNWDDMKDTLLMCNTSGASDLINFQGQVEEVPDGGLLLEKVKKDDRVFVRGIFPIYDARSRKVGGVFVLKDITHIYNALTSKKQNIVRLIILFMGILTFLMIFLHKRAERELREYRSLLEEMIEERTKELKVQFGARMEAEKKHSEAVQLTEQSARLASVGVMAAGITHEINQPLNAIKVTADSIQYWHKRNPGKLPEPFIEQLKSISKSVYRIVEIIQHMRTFWIQPNFPKISLINLNQAVKNALSLTRQQLTAHHIEHQFVSKSNPVPVKGNLIHFEQIVLNLISNAIHSLDETAKDDKLIQLTTASVNGFATLTIQDNGTGLPADNIDRLFNPFFSTKNSGEGMGLGLAIVKNYIDKYNGNITVNNNQKGGATFIIRFPIFHRKDAGE
jgi:signal transduction histidine kinase